MQIFFVVDEINGLEDKIDCLSRVFNADIKFFVPIALYTQINKNRFLLEHLAGVFDGSVNKKIDEYIKSEKFILSNVLLYYASANLSINVLKKIADKIGYRYDSIYVAKKTGRLKRFFERIYLKMLSLMFRSEDALCYTKVQYMSSDFMEHLKTTKFNNYILKAQNCDIIEIEDEKEKNNLKIKFKFEKYNLINIIAFIITLIIFIILINFLKLKFWVYFSFIMLILLEIALSIMLIVNNIFYIRYKN